MLLIYYTSMNKLFWKLRRLYYWRPDIWKEFKFTQELWRRTREDHDEIRLLEKKFMAVISKGGHDEKTVKVLEDIYLYLKAAWAGITCIQWHFEALKYACLRPTTTELNIHHEYREAAYRMFYRCSEYMIDARIKAGSVDSSKRAGFLANIAYLKDNMTPLLK